MKHDTYISYSPVDKELAVALESALNQVNKSSLGFGANRVFADHRGIDASFEPAPHDVRDALKRAKYFILLASPEAQHSKFVEHELKLWLADHPIENLVIVVTEGEITFDASSGEPQYTPLSPIPEILRHDYRLPPPIDLHWTRSVSDFKTRYQFDEAVVGISAILNGVSKDSLLDERARRSKKIRRAMYAAIALLIFVVVASVLSALYASQRLKVARQARQQAIESQKIAEQQAMIAEGYRQESRRSADQAAMLKMELERLRQSQRTAPTHRDVELEQSLSLAEAEADDNRREAENQRQIAEQYKQLNKQLYDDNTRLANGLTKQPGQNQSNSYLNDFVKQNLTILILGLSLLLVMLLFSTRLVLLLLQLDIALLKPLAIAFFYTPLGRWKLYRKYKKGLKEDANIYFHAQHYVDLPFESSDGGSDKALGAFLEDSILTRNVCIIAEGGRGKSTLAYKLALQSADGQLVINKKNPIPVVVDGLTYDGNLLESITSTLRQKRVYINAAIVESQIAAGNMLVILDGWSEVREFYNKPDESSDIPKLLSGSPDTRFIFTSRSELPVTIQNALGNAATVKLKDLDENTLDEFLGKYVERRKDEVPALARELKESTAQIPLTPLMLRLVAEIYDQVGQIPKDRISLFAQYVEKLLKPELIQRMDVAGLLYVIKHLVRNTYIATEGNRGFPIYKGVELIDQIKVTVSNFGIPLLPIDLLRLFSRAGLYKRSGEYLRFFHDSFESYFAARLLDDDFMEGKYTLLANCAANIRFIETIDFLVGMCKERNEHEKLIEVIAEARRTSGLPADVLTN